MNETKKALECLERLYNTSNLSVKEATKKYNTIKQALLKGQDDEKIVLGIEDYLNLRIETEPIKDVKKAFIEIRDQLHIIKEVVSDE